MQKKTKLQKEMMVPDVTTEKSGNTAAIDKLQGTLSDAYEFNLSDFILFMSVMKVKKAYEDVLSIILDETNLQLKEVKAEQVVLSKSGKETRYKHLPSTLQKEAYEMKYEIENKKRTTKKRRKKTSERDTTDISMKSKKRA